MRPLDSARRAPGVIPLLAASLALLAGCGTTFQSPPVDPSPPPVAGPGVGLRAGFGRADITPPPGAGLMGYGPEAGVARGWRTRLYARALVLEDATGERLGLVALDLGQLSPLLHREVAARIGEATGLGADRLVLAATHTHSAPGHHFGHPAYDELGTSVGGFDPRMVAFLADRIAAAVAEADASMAEARAAWGTASVWTLTRNRSEAPFASNPDEWRARFEPPLGELAAGHVDPTLTVLRIDTRDPGDGAFQPAGAFTVFAIHGTGVPSGNRLYDGDIQAVAARHLETHIDALNGRTAGAPPTAVHLVANGAEGDVAPDMAIGTRSQVPWLTRVRRPAGPRTPPGPELWIPPAPAEQAGRLEVALGETRRIGTELGEAVVAVFDSLGAHGHLGGDFTVRRVFQVVSLAGDTDVPGAPDLCHPQPGAATLAGADDGFTRYRGWRWLGMVPVGFAEDSTAVRSPPGGCHAEKEPFLGRLQRRYASRLLPEVAQITVADLGGTLLVTLPFEATTVVGAMVRDAALAGAAARRPDLERAVLVGLANGYNQYVASRDEYRLQHYEGASTLYGPDTAAFLVAAVRALAARLPAPGAPSPPAAVPALEFYRLRTVDILPSDDAGPPPDVIDPRRLDAAWHGDTLVARWTDLHPGRLVPAEGPVITFRYDDAAGNPVLTWDDDGAVEVWERGRAGAAWLWEARWTPGADRPRGPVEVALAERPGLRRVSIQVP